MEKKIILVALIIISLVTISCNESTTSTSTSRSVPNEREVSLDTNGFRYKIEKMNRYDFPSVNVFYSDSIDIFDGNVYIDNVNGIKGKNIIIVSSPGVTITETVKK